MEINVNDADKTVEIWLTNENKSDRPLRASLNPVYSAYKTRKYTVAVFESGRGDLFAATKELLSYNRTASARRAAGGVR